MTTETPAAPAVTTQTPAAQAAALRQVVDPRVVVAADRELDHPHPAEPAVQRADQRQQILDRGELARLKASLDKAELQLSYTEIRSPGWAETSYSVRGNVISPDKVVALQRNLVRYHLNGSGPDAAPDVVRATMLVRANCLARGYSGVRLELVQLLVDMLALLMSPQRRHAHRRERDGPSGVLGLRRDQAQGAADPLKSMDDL